MRKAWMIALVVLVCAGSPVFGGAQAETAAEEGPKIGRAHV